MARPSRTLTRRYEDELRLFRTRWSQAGLVALVALWALTPYVLADDFWLSVLDYAGIAAIGAIGLNLLTGYAGQVSLGHAAFLGVGAYSAGYLGSELELPFLLWLPAAALIGGLLGAVLGPFALRLRGNYLAIVTLGLVFLAEHVFRNLRDVTGGNSGRSVQAPPEVGPVDFSDLSFGGESFSNNQGWFWLVWGLVAVVALLAKNISRTRPGRALQAVRDRDVAAEVIGVQLGRTKVWAFAISSAFAALAGGLYGSYQQFVSPDEFSLFLSIQYIAIIIVGGVGTIFGAVLGALFLGGLPGIIERYSDSIPGVATSAGGDGFISVFSLNQAIFGALIVGFLVLEPRGLAALWLRAKAWFKAWPFGY
ncbi:branched-chain amino acid ABC transporter permease [Conexibacter sp. SYSU D00693]|uniref:branched-chain amino acid ABC transporter permease n=1 Tax=Conexibacter sp. SYSU D00693 TaxID=2812560 RepID=UPI00196B9397|nr:branched-chain amino acid ABC transporter permease [Conexibacter sp. SYSU D00693]